MHPSVPVRVILVPIRVPKLNPGAFKVNVLVEEHCIVLPVETIVPAVNVRVLIHSIVPENVTVPLVFIKSGLFNTNIDVPLIVPVPFITMFAFPGIAPPVLLFVKLPAI